MSNKLKRRKNCKDTRCQHKDKGTATEVMTLELKCSSDAKLPYRLSPTDKHDSYAASAAVSLPNTVQPARDERQRVCAENIKIAPIFLRTKQRITNKWSKQQCEPADTPCRDSHRLREDLLSEDLLSSRSTISHLKDKERPQLATQQGPLSHSLLHICLEAIQTSSPTFPVQTVFSNLQKKSSYGLQDLESTEDRHSPGSPFNCMSSKRKQGKELFESASKRPKVSVTAVHCIGMDHPNLPAQHVLESVVLPVKKQPRSSKLSRTQRLRRQSENSARLISNCEVKSECTDHIASDRQSPIMWHTVKEGVESSFKDLLWTDKYSPQCSSEVIGNSVSVKKLHSWLKKWKLRADSDDRGKSEETKQEENCSDLWDCGDFQGEAGTDDDGEETLCNTMLITGPPGVGKTASVYACAKELGFKIFEVNSSSQRSGCHVLSQLKEATQSHLVETSGKDPLKPAYFNNYTGSNCTTKSETSLGKIAHPKNIVFNRKKRAAPNCGPKGKANPTTGTLTNYFKMKVKADRLHFGGPSPSKKPEGKTLGNSSRSCNQTEQWSKKTATSLILFEEVDVIFDDDVGFLAAIKTFMTTTKRPVILTTNDPKFRERFCCGLEEIIFKTPSEVSLCSYLQLVGLAENVQLEFNDVRSLLRLTRGDVRRCLLQLQLWVHSGGGRPSQSTGLFKDPTCTERSLDVQLSPRQTGCSASMLGLTQMTHIQLLKHLKTKYWSETDMNKFLMLLTESWRRCVPLLYSNLELLLHSGAKGNSAHCLNMVTSPGMHKELASSDCDRHIEINKHVNSKSLTINSKHDRNFSRLSRRKCNTMFHTTSFFSLTQNISLNGAPSTAGSSEKTEEKAQKVDTNCLAALTDFFDAMSYIDAMLLAAGPPVSGPCRPETFAWTGAEIKEGMLDEMSEGESWSQERLFNIQASVEGLAFHLCFWGLSESWTRAKKEMKDKKEESLAERLMLPAASKRQNISFTVQPLCPQSVSQRRYEASRAVFDSEYFSLLGNRQAISVDYMPVVRAICRFQRAEQKKEEPLRYLNYFDNIHLGLSKSTMNFLAEDFL